MTLFFRRVILAFLFLIFFSGSAWAQNEKKVLYISSYHPAFPSFSQQVEGIRQVLDPLDVYLDIEFMDAKRFPGGENRVVFFNTLSFKLSRLPAYDALIVGDDNALVFALDHQEDLFQEIPVIFLGINDLENAFRQNSNPLVTGVVESVSMEETLRLMIDLQPGVSRIVALTDETISGQSDLKTFYNLKDQFSMYHFLDISLKDLSWGEYSDVLSGLGDESAVLLLSAYLDKHGEGLLFGESLALIKTSLKGPLYHLWYHGMGDGVLGGMLISHQEQGRYAGQMAARILEGTPAWQIPILEKSPNRYIFDYSQLKKYNIDWKRLPPGSLVINEPDSSLKKYLPAILVVFSGLLVLASVLTWALINLYSRKRTETALRESEEYLRSILEAAKNIGFIVTDCAGEDTRILDISPGGETIFCCNRREVIGQKVSIFHLAEDAGNFLPLQERLGKEGRVDINETVLVRKTGEKFPAILTLYPKLDNQGKMIGTIGISVDLTETKKQEAEKLKLEEQYQQTQKVESIGRLAGGVAHDLNNLLSPILGYSEMLIPGFDSSDSRKIQVEQIFEAGLRARDLVHQLLAFARKQALEYRPVKLNEMLGVFKDFLLRTIREDIQVKIVTPADVPAIKADQGQIEQVIMNIAVNAQDAMPSGGILQISTSEVLVDENYISVCPGILPGHYVILSISDNGTGMDEDTRSRIFEPFFSTKGEQGTGLGLATVYGIIKQHQGHIRVHSHPGEGTSFIIYLPVSDEQVMENREISPPPEDPSGSETILLAEDNEQVRNLARVILEGKGYQVYTAEDGLAALEFMTAPEAPVHLLITDVIMPGMNGKELFVKAAKIQPGLKVLYMSGYTDDAIAHEGVLEEGLNFIQKPFSVQALSEKVRKVLENRI